MQSTHRTKLAKLFTRHVRVLVGQGEIGEHDFLQYFQKAIRSFLYLTRHNSVIKRRLIKRKNTLCFQLNYMKHKCRQKYGGKQYKRKNNEIALTWSKRMVAYLKRRRALSKLNCANPSKLEPDDIKRLNERINKYKNHATKSASACGTNLASYIGEGNEVNGETVRLSANIADEVRDMPQDNILMQNNNSVDTNKPPSLAVRTPSTIKGPSFLDSLINKLRNERVESTEIVGPEIKKSLLWQKIVKNSKKDEKQEEGISSKYDSESSNSSDFCGFNDADAGSGLLPTPIVPHNTQSEKAAFVSEKLDEFLRENYLENKTIIEVPTYRRIEEGMVCEGSQPPNLNMQRVPDEFSKVRTVAEKRILLEKKRNVKYFIIENENTIYRELRRRSKYGQVNGSLIANIQNTEVPFTRDCWKATSWLRTSNGNYYFQILKVDDKEYKLTGTRGNHCQKVLGIQNVSPVPQRNKKGCPEGCKQESALKNIQLNLPEVFESESPTEEASPIEKPKRAMLLNSLHCRQGYKPGPLSRKRFKIDKGINSLVEIYQMPMMQLEVFPQVNQPLDEKIKPYLKIICPSEKISREWAEFAVSTVVAKPNIENKTEAPSRKSFTFDVPYANNQKTILVRKVFNRNEKFNPKIHNTDLSFRKDVNEEDAMEAACASMLSDIIDSVALGLCEDSLIKRDPCIDYSQNKIMDNSLQRNEHLIQPAESEKSPKLGISKPKATNKLLKELKRLNATIVEAESNFIQDVEICEKDFCRLGCVCQSLNGGSTIKSHCKKVECMFSCSCNNASDCFGQNDTNYLISREDAMVIREQATARLAKVEKDFSATVLLKGNSTYLLSESQGDKRRTKRVPKRFSDFVHEDVHGSGRDSEVELLPSKLAKEDDCIHPKLSFKHCNVSIRNIEDLQDLQPWCMIHCLYKCFCGGNSIVGEPFKFEQNAIVMEEVLQSRKRRYSFDKHENEVPTTTSVKRKYYAAGYVSGSRTSEIPSHIYIKLNREKAMSIKAMVSASETTANKKQLQMRIQQSRNVKDRQFVPIKARQDESIKDKVSCGDSADENKSMGSASETNANKNLLQMRIQQRKNGKNRQFVPLKARQDESIKDLVACDDDGKAMVSASETNANKKLLLMQIQQLKNVKDRQLVTIKARQDESINDIVSCDDSTSSGESCMPVDTGSSKGTIGKDSIMKSMVSASEQETRPIVADKKPSDFTKMPTMSSFTASDVGVSDNGKIHIDFYHKKTLGMLNLAVTRTMQSICNIQNQKLKMIPNPVAGTLCSAQWRYFLQAFKEYRIFIWEVCVRNKSILVATKHNTMPQVPGAICAANIRILSRGNLPLIANMLLDGAMSDNMKTMAILLAGQSSYWHIIGCSRSEQEYSNMGCIVKPTPQTHPQVSTKVNELYHLIFLREMENLRQKSVAGENRPQSPVQSKLVSSTNTTIERFDKLQAVGVLNAKNRNSTNLEFKVVREEDAASIIIPIPHEKDHLWLMIDLQDDFSHIYFPDWKDFLTYERINKSFLMALKNRKTVRFAHFKGSAHIYATPQDSRRMYIGPFFEHTSINLILCQNMDGKIISREDYENGQKVKHLKKTVAYWLRIRNSALIFDELKMDSTTIKNLKMADSKQKLLTYQQTGTKDKRNIGCITSNVSPSCHSLLKSSTGSFVMLKDGMEMKSPRLLTLNRPIISKTEARRRMQAKVGKSPLPMQPATAKLFSDSMCRKLAKKNVKSACQPESSTTLSHQKETKEIKKVFYLKTNETWETSTNSLDSRLNSTFPKITQIASCLPSGTTVAKEVVDNAANYESATDQIQQRRSGYFISGDVALGKVLAHKTLCGNYCIKMRDKLDWMPFPDEEAVERFLNNVVKEFTKGRYSSNVRWRYVPLGLREQKYRLFSLQNLNKCCEKVISQKRLALNNVSEPVVVKATASKESNKTDSVPVLPSSLTLISKVNKIINSSSKASSPTVSMKLASESPEFKRTFHAKRSSGPCGVTPHLQLASPIAKSMPTEVILIDD